MQDAVKAQSHNPLIGQPYKALGGLAGIVLAVDQAYGFNHLTGRDDVPLNRILVECIDDRAAAGMYKGMQFTVYAASL